MIKALWRSIFKPKLEIGDIFEFDNWEIVNPFEEKETWRVVVKDVQKGWVNYRWADSTYNQNESLKLGIFHFCYKKI